MEVVVLHEQVAARRDRVPQPFQHGDPLRQVVEQQPGVDEVERGAGNRLVGGQVDACEVALAMARVVQHRHRLRAQRRVDVDPGDAARRPDALGHQPHRLARAAAGVQAGRARGERDLVEQASGRGLPDARLGAQALVLLRRAPERVALLRPLGLGGAHRDPFRRSSCAIVADGRRARIVDAPTIFRRGLWRLPGGRRRVDAMAVLLDRDAEVTELARRLAWPAQAPGA